MAKERLNRKHRYLQILTYVDDYQKDDRFGMPPTQIEISKEVGISISWVWRMLTEMQTLGYVDFEHNVPKTVRITDAGHEYMGVHIRVT